MTNFVGNLEKISIGEVWKKILGKSKKLCSNFKGNMWKTIDTIYSKKIWYIPEIGKANKNFR